MSRIGNRTRLILTLAICDDHTNVHLHITSQDGDFLLFSTIFFHSISLCRCSTFGLGGLRAGFCLLSFGCCCCCFSHSAHWLPTRKKLLYTVANPARGLLNREKKKKKKSGSAAPPPPPARCLFGEKIKIIK